MNRRTRLARYVKSDSAKPALHKQHRLRESLEPLEDRMMLSAVTWTIDQTQSDVAIAIPDQPFELDDGMGTVYSGTLRIRNQSGSDGGPWNVGNSAEISGTIATEYTDGASIEFLLGQSDISGVNSGSYIPDPANWNGTDFGGSLAPGPGVFGGRIRPTVTLVFFPVTVDVGYFNFTDVQFDVGSGALPITVGSFPANTTDIGLSSALANVKGVDVPLAGQILPDTQAVAENLLATNQAPTGTITSPDPIGQPNLRQLTVPIVQNFSIELSPTTPPFTGSITGQIVATATLPDASTVAGRHIFYNDSFFDGNSAAQSVADDAAIPTKVAYLKGDGLAVYNNITNFTKGITGFMVDLDGGGDHSSITAADFSFKHGNNDTPGTWAAVAATPTVGVRLGDGDGGADRVTVTWATNDIKNEWVEVQVLATANTGLASADVHYWGNRTADSGEATPATFFQTTTSDSSTIFGHLTGSASVDNDYDYNRSGNVTTSDSSLVFGFLGNISRINIAPPPAPAGDDDGGGSAVASALAVPESSVKRTVPSWVSHSRAVAIRRGPVSAVFAQFAEADSPAELIGTDGGSDELDSLIDALRDQISV